VFYTPQSQCVAHFPPQTAGSSHSKQIFVVALVSLSILCKYDIASSMHEIVVSIQPKSDKTSKNTSARSSIVSF
jgi:hypothetical protein